MTDDVEVYFAGIDKGSCLGLIFSGKSATLIGDYLKQNIRDRG